MKIINKIAFLVHEPTMYTHYSSVWEVKSPNTFVVIFLAIKQHSVRPYNQVEDLKLAKQYGFETIFLDELPFYAQIDIFQNANLSTRTKIIIKKISTKTMLELSLK